MNPSLRTRLLLAASTLLSAIPSFAVPVAVDDSYSMNEDASLATGGGAVITANFEPQGNVIAGSWDYLDKIKNNQNGQTADTYPVDGAARDWKSLLFDKTTSTVAGWQSAVPPLQGGGIDGFPGAPITLTGYSTASGVPYNITTYLFRKSFTLDAAAAAATQWTLRHLVDDAAIFYVNGVEIHRVRFDPATNYTPAGALTTNTSTNVTIPSESVYTTDTITLPGGLLVAGANIFAVEVHQGGGTTFASTDVGIDVQLSPAGSTAGGFTYLDDPFETNRPENAGGALLTTGGNPGGALYVELGRINALNFSGGWQQNFNLTSAGTVRFAFDWKIAALGGLEPEEYSAAVLMVDGVRYGSVGTAPNLFLGQIFGDGASDLQSPWTAAVIDVPLAAGTHTVTIGGFCNKTTTGAEHAASWFDNVNITMLSGGNGVLANDTGGAVTAQLVSTTSSGTLNLQANGQFSYQPNLNFFGTDTFTYRALDGAAAQSNAGTVTITVNPVNDAPQAVANSYSTNQQQTLAVNSANGVLANDTDVDNSPAQLSAVLVTAPQVSEGTLTLNPDGSFTFVPAAAFVGTASFVYRASDGSANSADVTVSITVSSTGNNIPVANNDSYTTAVNSPLVVNTLVAGTTTTDDVIPFGSTVVSSIWRYLDNGSDQGTAWRAPAFDDSLWKTGGSELGYGQVPADEVTVVEDNPTPGYTTGVNDRFATTYFRRQFTVNRLFEVTAASLSLVYDDGAVVYLDGGEIFRTTTMSGAGPNPAYNYYTNTTSANNATASQAVSVSLLDEGSNYIASEIHQTTPSSSDISFNLRLRLTRAVPAGLLANDTDLDAGTVLTVSTNTNPSNGSLTLNANGTFTYTPNTGYIGPDSFTYRCTDGSLLSNIATVNLTVVPGPNVRPIANNDTYNATEDITLNVNAAAGVLANDNDADGDAMTAVLVTGPASGSLTLNPDGSFSYIPVLNFAGSVSFTYTANDAGGPSAPKIATINVANVNDAPVAANDSFSTDPGVTLVVSAPGVLGNDTDVDAGATLTAALVSGPASGTLSLNPNGSLNYAPAAGFTGTVTFTYRANDGAANSNNATVSIKVNGRPVAIANTYPATEDTVLTVNPPGVLGNDTDPENDPLTAIIVSNPSHGSLSLLASGGFTYTPAGNYNGPDSFTYKANDGARDSLSPATVTINIAGVNDAPVAAPDNYATPLDVALFVPSATGVLNNDSDVDGQTITAVLNTPPANGFLGLNPDGSFSYTPNTGYTGLDSFTYRATDGAVNSSVVTVNISVGIDLAKIAISEIHYHPQSLSAGDEFVEVFNGNPGAIDVGGWQFTAGVNYTLPPGTVIPGGGYLVVAANPVQFTATFAGVALLRGPWIGELSNSGETIRLKTAAGETVDEVTYADEGDWAIRYQANIGGQTGWEWYTRADANGSSLELINPALDNDNGQNWFWSGTGGTDGPPSPGAANGRASANIAPLIFDLDHRPQIPRSTDPVTVTVNVQDESLTPPTVVLYWRVNTASPGAYTQVAMFDDGAHGDGLGSDGEFGAVIPPQANGTLIEFFVAAADASSNTRTWPMAGLNATFTGWIQECNAFYQVDEEAWANHYPIYRLIGTAADVALFLLPQGQGGWNRGSDAQLNVTLVAKQGADVDVRYRCGLRVRGAGSRGNPINNWRLNIPKDDDWGGETEANLNVWHPHLGDLGSKMMECAGLIHERSWPVQVRLNTTNNALNNSDYSGGYYIHLLPIGGEYLNELRPNDDDGNLYKKERPHQDWTVRELSPGGPPSPSGYQGDGWVKQSNEDLNDWNDLHNLLKTFAGTTPTLAQMETVMNLDYWLRWQAFQTIINHNETNLSNGSGDDYSLYRGIVDPRFIPLAHDFDTVWGDGGNTSSYDPTLPTDTIYQVTGDFGSTSERTPALLPLFSNPVTNQRFKAQLVELLNTVFLPSTFNSMVDSVLGDWTGPTAVYGVPVSKRDAIKGFNTARRNHILQTVLGYTAGGTPPAALTVTTSLPLVSGYPQTTAANSTGLSGTVDSSRVQIVRINGTDIAPNNFQSIGNGEGGNGPAPWSAGTAVTLRPGINRLTVEAIGANNTSLASQTIELWYDDGGSVTKSGTLAASETWTAAGGPYQVTASLVVPAGVTLTIEPGTTVYAAAGVTIQATGTGRILAEGTPAARIRFSALPGGANWGALDIINATNESRFTFCDFENMAGTTVSGRNAKCHVDNAIALFDNTRWGNAPAVQYISFVNSSFVVSNSIFPTYAGTFNTTSTPEMLHGSNGIPVTGYGIFRDCYFGHTWGFNDTIDFTGGNRPGAILQVINCVFDGATDDCLDLDSTDAWIEGNVFFNVHQDTQRPDPQDTASAISGGQDNTAVSEWTIINNVFYDVDHAVLAKNRNRFTFINNTVRHVAQEGGAGVNIAAFNFSDTGLALSPLADGQGGYVSGNVIQDCANLVPASPAAYNPANVTLQMVQNLFPAGVSWSGPGSNNVSADAVLNIALLPAPGVPTAGTPEAGVAKAAAIRAALMPLPLSPALCTGLFGKDKGAYHASGIEIAGEPVAPVSGTSVTLSVGPGGTFSPGSVPGFTWGYTSYSYSLDGGPYSAEIPVSTPLTLNSLSAGPHSVSVLGKTDAGVWQTVPTVSRTFTVNPAGQPIVINEVLASNVNAYPVGALRPDYIELRNLSSSPVDLIGWSISDDSISATTGPKYIFSGSTIVPANGYLLLATNTLGFNLDADEDEVFLYSGSAFGSTLVDSVHFGFQITDKSIGRTCTNLTWALNNPTPGAENVLAELGTPALVRINEWSGNNDFIVEEDFVELYNAGPLPAALAGLVLTDDHINYPLQNVVAPLSFIDASGFVLFRADGNTASGSNHVSFNIGKMREGITLLGTDGRIIDHIMSAPLTEDVTGGRASDGGAVFTLFGPSGYANLPTPGYSNTTDLTTQQELMENLRITELMYNPPGNSSVPEYIEFRNLSATLTLNLSTVRLTDGVTFQFAPGTQLAPGAFICITQATQTAFNNRWPGAPYGGSYTGYSLSNAGEHLRLEIDGFELGILDFTYDDAWYPITDGGGAALEIVNAAAGRDTWGFKESWRATSPNPGLNGVFSVIAGEDTTACLPNALPLEAVVTFGSQNPGSVTYQWTKVSGPGTVSFSPSNTPATSITFGSAGTYVLRFTATGAVAVSDEVTIIAAESYDAWAVRTLASANPLITGPLRDPDFDGLANVVEFALGLNPASGSQSGLPTLSIVSGQLVLTYQRYAGCGLNYIVEASDDLITWSSSTVTEQMTGSSGAFQTWTATDGTPVFGTAHRFMRVRVELQP